MMRVAGVILAGGAARRMGGEKPLKPFAGGVLLDAVIARAAPQVESLALNVPCSRREAYAARFGGYPFIDDEKDAPQGPLAGLLAGLHWLGEIPNGPDWLASFPCDTPFLPADLVVCLLKAATPAKPAVIRAGGEIQSLCALWPRGALAPLRKAIADGRIRSVRDALFGLEARILSRESRAQDFFNINTPEDLAAAEALMKP